MIRFKTVFNAIGKIILIVAGAMLLPLLWSLITGGPDFWALFIPFLIMVALGGFLAFYVKPEDSIRTREGYLIVTSCWLVIIFLGSLPYVFSGAFPSYSDALFESVAGFTTTGASVLADVTRLSPELLLWRSLTQWLGGLGVVVLFVALLTRMDTGGTIMFKAELAGPFTERITSHIDDSAKILWVCYMVLTAALVALLYLGDMTLHEALCHGFSTISTGGFSTRNEGIAYFDSMYIKWVLIVFMFVAGMSYALLYKVIIKRDGHFFKNEEFRLYFIIVVFVTLLVFVTLYFFYEQEDVGLGDIAFQVVSQLTTTGFTYMNYDVWPAFAHVLMLVLMMIGACYTSSSGSLKIGMYLLLAKNVRTVLFRMLHPQALTEVKINGKVVKDEVVIKALQYFFLFVISIFIGAIALSATGLSFHEAMTGAMAAVTNNGPGSGAMGPLGNYSEVTAAGKWILSTLMLLGRLEFYTVLIVFIPSFWKQ